MFKNLHTNPFFKTLLHFLEIGGLYVASTTLTSLLNSSAHWGIPPEYAIFVPLLVMAIQTALKSVNAAQTQLAATNALNATAPLQAALVAKSNPMTVNAE